MHLKIHTNKIRIKTIHKGDGVNFPKKGDTVTVQYTGRLENGAIFDSSLNKGRPFKFVVGEHKVIKGWDIAILRLSKGQSVKVFIPARLAYGNKRVGGKIPANSNLIFNIQLIKIHR